MKKKILVVGSTYYKDSWMTLTNQVKIVLEKNKLKNDFIKVPGVFEIPVVISRNIKRYDGFIALGCVIKGETPHFEFISRASIDAIMKLSIDSKKPIGNGIITCLNSDQAIVRSKTKGSEAAIAVIDVLKNDSKN
jgi:6,7-dimethyl-8-ribityllumazine synthase